MLKSFPARLSPTVVTDKWQNTKWLNAKCRSLFHVHVEIKMSVCSWLVFVICNTALLLLLWNCTYNKLASRQKHQGWPWGWFLWIKIEAYPYHVCSHVTKLLAFLDDERDWQYDTNNLISKINTDWISLTWKFRTRSISLIFLIFEYLYIHNNYPGDGTHS